jgi:hypothetical protein
VFTFLTITLHDGSPWVVLACLVVIAGVIAGLFTEAGSGIATHPYSNPYIGGQLASDLPPESLGRAALEPILRRRR